MDGSVEKEEIGVEGTEGHDFPFRRFPSAVSVEVYNANIAFSIGELPSPRPIWVPSAIPTGYHSKSLC